MSELASNSRSFLSGGGEMGARMRELDWSGTVLGSPDNWPQPLRTAIRFLLTSGHPMYIWWGPELGCLYNDAYAHSIGPERHPCSLGQPGRHVWEEIWHIIGPQIDHVLQGNGAVWHENALVPITRNGKVEDVYWTYSYSPIDHPEAPGGVGGVLVICTETTKTITAEQTARLTEERFTRLFEQSPNFMTVLRGPDHVFEYCNPAYYQVVGHRDILGKPVAEAIPESVGQGFTALLDQVLKSGEPFRAHSMPIKLQRRPNAPADDRLLDFVYQPIIESDGTASGIFVEGTDVTERFEFQKALQESEEQLRLATGAAEIGMWDVDLVSKTRFWTARTKAMFGLAEDAPVDMEDFENFLHPDDRDRVNSAFKATIDPDVQAPYDIEYRVVTANGEVRWLLAKGKAIFDASGKAIRALGTAIDITELKRSNARREALMDLTDAIRAAASPEDIAEQAARILGETLEVSRVGLGELSDDRRSLVIPRDWVSPGVRSLQGSASLVGAEPFLEELDAGRVVKINDVYRNPLTALVAGEWDAVSARSVVNVPILERGNLVSLFFVNDADVREWTEDDIDFIREVAERTRTATARLRSENALRQLNAELEKRVDEALAERRLFAEIVETTDALIQVLDTDYNVLAINAASAREFARVIGRPLDVGDNQLEALAHLPQRQAEARELWSRAFRGEKFTLVVELGEGTEKTAFEFKFTPLHNHAGEIIGAYQIVYDVTERMDEQARFVLAQEQLRQAQKMDAVGQLTGGVAHDFNNMLAVVIGSLELLTRRLGDDVRSRHYAHSALDAARRSATLTQRLLAFSRQQPLRPETLNPNRLVSGMSDLLSHALGGAVRLETVLAAGVWSIHVDANQLENVIVNLGVNARDAMPDGGKVTIETQNVHFDARYVANEPGLSPGQYVMIAVSDTGNGMPAEVVARAFDPFFTTKEVGKGTGLGLSQAYGFVKQSGGHIKIYSEPGQGTTLKVYLPKHIGESVQEADTSAETELLRGDDKEVILVVDDEAFVRDFSVAAITELGYRVLQADGAAAALQIARENPDIALLFTDIVMPEVNGRKLADQIRAFSPDIKVLYTTPVGHLKNTHPWPLQKHPPEAADDGTLS